MPVDAGRKLQRDGQIQEAKGKDEELAGVIVGQKQKLLGKELKGGLTETKGNIRGGWNKAVGKVKQSIGKAIEKKD